jgi:hypothetical protein
MPTLQLPKSCLPEEHSAIGREVIVLKDNTEKDSAGLRGNLMKNRSKSNLMRQPEALPRSVLAGRTAQCLWADGRLGDRQKLRSIGNLVAIGIRMTTRWRLQGGNFNALGGFIGGIRSLG